MGLEPDWAHRLESLRAEQAERWRAKDPVWVEDIFRRFPDLLSASDCALELVYNEIFLRKVHGEKVDLAEYQRRFSQWRDPLRCIFEVEQWLESGAEDPSPPPAHWPRIPGFEILAEQPPGSMGRIFKAWQLRPGRLVALKLLQIAHRDAETLRRFYREAELLATLQHPGIVQIHEVAEVEGNPYLVLEW